MNIPGGGRVVMRQPTEDEWRTCVRRNVLISGPGGETETGTALPDLARELLVEGLIPDGWHDWVLARVLRFKPTCEASPDGVRVEAQTAGGATVRFVFKMPSAVDADEYLGKSFARVSAPNGSDGMVIDAAWILSRYEALFVRCEGYEDGDAPPVWHQVDAMDAAFGFVRRLMQAEDADFFVEADGPLEQLAS